MPTTETGQAFGILLTQALETVTISSAPAPSDRGTILAISLLVGLTALAVDPIGGTHRSPALAGMAGSDFGSRQRAVAAGRTAALHQLPALKRRIIALTR